MTFEQTQAAFEKYILARWSNWQPNNITLADWIKSLQKYEEMEICRSAFQYVQMFEKYNEPKLPKMLTLLQKAANARLCNQGKKYDEPVLAYSCKCIEHEKRPEYVGKVINFYESNPQSLQKVSPVLPTAAKLTAERLGERIYGGKWIVISDSMPGES